MILFVPVIFLLISAALVVVVIRLNVNIGRIWLISTLMSLINWGIILAFKWFMPIQFINLDWFPFVDYFQESIVFTLDQYSWALAFALASIQLAIFLTDSTRLDELPSLNIWAGIFVINAIGYLAVLSNSLLAIFLLWTLIDFVELIIVLLTVRTIEMVNVGVISFAVKMAGIVFLMITVFRSYSLGIPLSFEKLTVEVSPFMLVAVGLRLGVIPFNLPYLKEIPLRIGLGNTIRMVGVASGLAILIRISPSLSQNNTAIFFLPLFALAGFVASLMWLVSNNELIGRPYWIISLASFSIFSAIKGDEISSLLWAINLLVIGSVLFLYSEKDKRILFLPMFAILGLSGLPFTPSAFGWNALADPKMMFTSIVNLISVSFLILGFTRHALQKGHGLKYREKWLWVVYPAGLFFLVLTQWLIFLLSPFDWISYGVIWASLIAFLLSIVVLAVFRRINRVVKYTDWLISLLNRFGAIIISILSLNWLYKSLWYALRIISAIVNLFSSILESQTGIIWIFILIAVMVTIIVPGNN